MDGHIKLHRRFLDWEWYKNAKTKELFIHMLLKANWKDGKFMGTTVPRGSFVSSIKSLSDETGLTESEVRTGIRNLKKTGEVTSEATNKYSVFTIKNYDSYQSDDRQDDKQMTSRRQADDKQMTTIEERKKEIKKEDNKNYSVCFEQVWQAYPRKVEKAAAYRAYKARLADGFSEDELETAVKRYAQSCKSQNTETRYIKHAATFFSSSTPFMDYLHEEGPEKNEGAYVYNSSDI